MNLPRARGRVINRLVGATVASGLTAGLLGAALIARSSSAAALSDARTRNLALAEQYAVRIDTRVENLLDVLRLVTSRREVAAVGDASGELRVVLRAYPTFDELVLYDGAGRPVGAAAARFLTGLDRYAPEPGLLDEVNGDGMVRIERTSQPRVTLAVPVEDPPGTVVGTLVGHAPIESVTSPIEGVVPHGDPSPFLVDDEGNVLVHRDRSRVDTVAFPLGWLGPAASGSEAFQWDDHGRLFAAARAERLRSTVVVEQPESIARAAVGERLRELLTILAIVVLAAVTGVIAAGEVLLRPLGPLTRAVERVRRGERGVRTEIGGRGEIGLLATELDRMAAALDRRDDQLAQLQHLSLLVGSLADRGEVQQHITIGVVRLVDASASALVELPGEGPATLVASAGELSDPDDLLDIASLAAQRPGVVRRPDGASGELLAVHLSGADGGALGVIVAHRREERFTDDDEHLVAAFAAFAAVAIDNAHRLALQRALGSELQDAVNRRRDLISTITHEFRTPLACIEGFSSALEDGWERYSEDEQRDLVARIGHHAGELDELVNRFLDFSVAEHHGLTAQLSTVALDRVIAQVVATLAPLLHERRVQVSTPRIDVTADPAHLRRTLSNLLSNAVKYSSPGSSIWVDATADGPHVRVDVTDEGIGLSAEDTAKAFEPFWRGGPAATRTARGAGLGLSLVAEYVRVMGGTYSVTSELGRGSTFSFTVPAATVHPNPVGPHPVARSPVAADERSPL